MISEVFDNAIDLAPLHTFTTLFDLPQHDIEMLLNDQAANYNDYYQDYYYQNYEEYHNPYYNYSPSSSNSSSPGPISDMFGFCDGYYQTQYQPYPQPLQQTSPQTPQLNPSRKMRPSRKSPTGRGEVDIDSLIVKVRSARVKLGFTQAEFAKSMKTIFKRSFSQTTVCRFEGKQLTNQNMLKLVPLFEKWLQCCSDDIESVRKSIY